MDVGSIDDVDASDIYIYIDDVLYIGMIWYVYIYRNDYVMYTYIQPNTSIQPHE